MSRDWSALFQLLGIGWYVAFVIALGTLAGVWLDGATGRAPLFVLIGLGLGLVTALLGAYRLIARAFYSKEPGGPS